MTGELPIPADCSEKFEFKRWISSGGFGAVFLAVHRELGRPAAIKIMLENLQDDPAFVARFNREARLAASISHVNVVKVLDFGCEGRAPWIAYEFVEGENLRDYLRRRHTTVRELLEITAAVANGLDQIHARGIVHRDIKPENVLRSTDGTCKITDFGVAKETVQGENMTRTGVIIGTPHYLAPEVISGGVVGPATDIYALAVMLFEMVTGQPPYTSENPVTVLKMHLDRAVPPVRALRPDLPVSLDALIACAMAKRPADRPGSALQFREEIEKIAQSGEARDVQATLMAQRVALKTLSKPPRRWWWIPAIGLLLALAVLVNRRLPAPPSAIPSPHVLPQIDLFSKEAIPLWAPRLGSHIKAFWMSTNDRLSQKYVSKSIAFLDLQERSPDPEKLMAESVGLNLLTFELLERSKKLKAGEKFTFEVLPRMELWINHIVADLTLLGDLTLDPRRPRRSTAAAHIMEVVKAFCLTLNYRKEHGNMTEADRKELAKLEEVLNRWGETQTSNYMVTIIRTRAAGALEQWDRYFTLCKLAESQFPPLLDDTTSDASVDDTAGFWVSLVLGQLDPIIELGMCAEAVQLLERAREKGRKFPRVAARLRATRGEIDKRRSQLLKLMESRGMSIPRSFLEPF
jgi:serine/threonine protein kinase